MPDPYDTGLRREAYAKAKRGEKPADIAIALGKSEAWVRAAMMDPGVKAEVHEFRANPPVEHRGRSRIGGY